MRQRPWIAISIAKVAKEHGWARNSVISGERYAIGDDTVILVRYAADGRIRSAWFFYGRRDGEQIKGGHLAVKAELERFGRVPTCGICGRTLDVPGVDESTDCGGDCAGCIRKIEAEMGEES
jgi:hypothetical protein